MVQEDMGDTFRILPYAGSIETEKRSPMSQTFLTPEQQIRQRYAWFEVAARLGNVTGACKRCGPGARPTTATRPNSSVHRRCTGMPMHDDGEFESVWSVGPMAPGSCTRRRPWAGPGMCSTPGRSPAEKSPLNIAGGDDDLVCVTEHLFWGRIAPTGQKELWWAQRSDGLFFPSSTDQLTSLVVRTACTVPENIGYGSVECQMVPPRWLSPTANRHILNGRHWEGVTDLSG
jgi:hypothetical protein